MFILPPTAIVMASEGHFGLQIALEVISDLKYLNVAMSFGPLHVTSLQFFPGEMAPIDQGSATRTLGKNLSGE